MDFSNRYKVQGTYSFSVARAVLALFSDVLEVACSQNKRVS